MANVNERIFKEGMIVEATKLPVITIGLGPVSALKDLNGTIWHDHGNVVIATKEAPGGCLYDQARTAVVRIIGGNVKMHGMYDIYAPDNNKIQKLLSNPFDLSTLTDEQQKELQPILASASEVRPSLAPAEHGRKVIVITHEMVGEQGYMNCHCSWDPEDVLTKLYEGDIFLVRDPRIFKGYRMGKEEFAGTHELV